jgi:hypothetical protein
VRKWLVDNESVASWSEVAIILVAAIIAIIQLAKVNDGLRSQASSAVFDQQLEINKLFLQDEDAKELIPYFFDGQELPEDHRLRPQANMIAGSILDFFSHVEDQQEADVFSVDRGWAEYMDYSFENSPTLCEVLEANQALYSNYLLSRGQESCNSQNGLSPTIGASAAGVEAPNQGTDWPTVWVTLLAAFIGAIVGGISTYIASKRTTIMQLRASLRIKMYDVILPQLRAHYGNWRIDDAGEAGYHPPASLDRAFITEVEELHRTGVVIGRKDRIKTRKIRDKVRERATANPRNHGELDEEIAQEMTALKGYLEDKI